MRISSSMLHDLGSRSIGESQSRMFKLQEQLSSGKRVNRPDDDPIAAAASARLADSMAKNRQFLANQDAARNTLQYTEQIVGSVGDALQAVRERLVQGANSTLRDDDRRAIAEDLRSAYGQLLGLANSRDEAGNFLFAGSLVQTQPFADAPSGATYQGDQGRSSTQVSASRVLGTGENGAELFVRILTGNGQFATSGATSNTGTGVIDQGSVVDPAALTADHYQIIFDASGPSITYDVFDTTTATSISTGNAWTTGQAIQISGMQVSITGTPATGDVFELRPSPTQSIFETLKNAVAALERGRSTPADQARFDTEMGAAIANVDLGIERTLTVRAGMGANLREIEGLQETTAALQDVLTADLSGLVDLDYAAAISEFMREQQGLEAARAAYGRIAQQSLFDLLR